MASLEADKAVDLTFDDVQLNKGDRKLTATVDSKKTVTESKNDNNELKATASCQDEGD